jgi:rhodanese-related sulfurtransferase
LALKSIEAGIKDVRPLAGGFIGWKRLGYPVEAFGVSAEVTAREG